MDRRLGKFVFVETDYEANINEIDASKNEENNLESFIASALLHPAVAHVVAMVFNVHAMKQLMLEYSVRTSYPVKIPFDSIYFHSWTRRKCRWESSASSRSGRPIWYLTRPSRCCLIKIEISDT